MDLDSKKPMRKDTIFRMASLTKPVTGVAIMMMIEEGKVAADRPGLEVHPRVQGDEGRRREGAARSSSSPAEREITIRDLMTHTSGLVSGGLGPAGAAGAAPAGRGGDDAGRGRRPGWRRSRSTSSPGTRWRYSGLAGIDTLARVVEVASGQSFDEFLEAGSSTLSA